MVTITRAFDSHADAKQVVTELENAGIASSDISLIANQAVSEEYGDGDTTDTGASEGIGLGAVVGGGAGLLAGLGMMAIPGLGPIVAAGWLASTAFGALAGATTGGLIGALIATGESEDHAHVYAESVRRGSTLVTVRASDDKSDVVSAIMDGHNPFDPIERHAQYSESGWTRFEEAEEASTPPERRRAGM